jgi:hypothetical protein
MSELSVKEQEVLDFLINFIETEIFIIEDEEREKGRLDYSLCSNDVEKLIITKKKIKKFKSRIHDCNPVVAGYLSVLTSPYPSNNRHDELRLVTIRNFLFSDYSELFDDLVKEDISDLEKYEFKNVIKSMGYKYKNLKDFIQGVCDVGSFLSYKSLLEITNNENNNVDHIDNDIENRMLNQNIECILQSDKVASESYNLKNLIIKSDEYFENLINDPLLKPENEYIVLSESLKSDQISKAISSSNNGLFVTYDYEPGFEEWEEQQKVGIDKSFISLVKVLNFNKIFFFGCSSENYKHNYDSRLKSFIDELYDASEIDFVDGELEFLENILYDIQNSEAAHDGYSVSGYSNFSKAYDIITKLGYKQYFFSNNKKIDFLNEQKVKISLKDLPTKEPIFEEKKIPSENQISIQIDQNNLLRSTIEDYIEEFKIEINGDGYNILVNALFEYFSKGSFPILKSIVNFKKINKKRLGWALKELYKSEKTDNLDVEYFRFAQENINLFQKEVIEIENFNKSKFYKAFTSNPAK